MEKLFFGPNSVLVLAVFLAGAFLFLKSQSLFIQIVFLCKKGPTPGASLGCGPGSSSLKGEIWNINWISIKFRISQSILYTTIKNPSNLKSLNYMVIPKPYFDGAELSQSPNNKFWKTPNAYKPAALAIGKPTSAPFLELGPGVSEIKIVNE